MSRQPKFRSALGLSFTLAALLAGTGWIAGQVAEAGGGFGGGGGSGTPVVTPTETSTPIVTPTESATPIESPSPEASASPSPTAAAQQDVIATLQAAGQYTTFLQALQLAGLTAQLQGTGPFTVFAPNDAAFAAIPEATRNQVLTDPTLLNQVLQYHIANGQLSSTELANQTSLATLEGENLTIASVNGQVQVNGNAILQPDLQASNGVAQGIGVVLVPPSAAAALGGASPTPSASPEASPSVAPEASPSPEVSASPSVSPSPGV